MVRCRWFNGFGMCGLPSRERVIPRRGLLLLLLLLMDQKRQYKQGLCLFFFFFLWVRHDVVKKKEIPNS